jgi:squalene synthase HpnC
MPSGVLSEPVPPDSSSLPEAYAACERQARGHYENFSVLSWLVPRDKRPSMAAVYAFCRGVDDLGDEAASGGASPEERLRRLGAWERQLRGAFRMEGGDAALSPAFLALRDTAERHRLPAEPFLNLIEANRMDQCRSRYENFAELARYCRHSANPVGRIVLRLFGHAEERLDRLSDQICTALQLANFWQDVGSDWRERGRLYVPLDEMARFGVSEEQVVRGEASDSWRELMRFQIGRTRALFHEGEPLVTAVDAGLRGPLRLFIRGGREALRAVERADYDVFRRRPRVPRGKKAMWMAALAFERLWRGLAGKAA